MLEVVTLFLLAVAVVFVAMSLKIVPQQKAWLVERLGRYYGTLGPGLNIVLPFVDRIAYEHGLKEVAYDVQPQVCITRDNTQVTIDGILYFQVTDPYKASYGSDNYIQAITSLAQTVLRSKAGQYELDKLLEERQEINVAVTSALDEASANWGVKVLRYEVKDITPPESVLRAMQMQITAEREKRALIAKSEGERQQQINLAEGEKAAAIAQSEGEKQAAINKAQGEAQAILLVAEATAKAIEQVATATQQPGGMDAVNLKVAERYVDAFGQIAKESTTMIIPGNMADMAGLIGTAMSVVKGVRAGTA